jgi:hypothetical protein
MFGRRRRPLLRAAMIGGTAYAAGRHAVNVQEREADEQARLEALEAQAAYAPPPPPPGGVDDIAAKLTQLKTLRDEGVLTQDEFDAAKQKLLAG